MAYPVMPVGFLGSQGDQDTYRIERSLRFNSSDSAYLSRTPASTSTRRIFTISAWVKISNLYAGLVRGIYSGGTGNFWDSFYLSNVDDNIRILFDGGNGANLTSSGLFRDLSAWYHFAFSVDTTQATASNRVKMFVNGVQQTLTGTQPVQNYQTTKILHSSYTQYIGATDGGAGGYNGYMTEFYLVDGQALTPSSFGETDAITGRWKAKAFTGTYGTNGFYLKFADNSGTTSTTLGKDSSPNGNNWTTNNFSVTAGAGNDSLTDSPTNYGTDTGVGGEVRGNYCTLNPLSVTSGTFVQGNLRYSGPSGWRRANGNFGVSSGKWYWEVTLGNAPFSSRGSTTAYNSFGFGLSTVFNSTNALNASTDAIGLSDSGYYKNFSGPSIDGGTAFSSGDTLSVAVDLDANTFTFYRNSSQLVTGTIGGTAGRELVPVIISYDGSYGVMDCNFGQRPFAYTAPTGFKALCTTNLPTPSIQKPSTAMDVVTYTGNGSTQSITGLGFSPDLVWAKARSAANWHVLVDSVRGASKYLNSNVTDAEVTNSSIISSLDSNGFTMGSNATINGNANTNVAWVWDAGSSDVTNTAGSITSTVRADATKGFSIVSFVNASGTNQGTVGHGLGVALKLIIAKNRDTSANNWAVFHSSVCDTTSKFLQLNTTAATQTFSTVWGASLPTASVFGVTGGGVAAAGVNVIAYCFSEIEGYSKFGSYTGNGSSDGPFVWCGFRPRWILIKDTGGAINWRLLDTQRDSFNLSQNGLVPNSSGAESTTNMQMDILSNGFKIRVNADINANGNNHIFAAFAEAPFKYARAR